MTRRRPRRRGYVLLVTLALLVLSTTLLVAVGRAAVRHAAQAQIDRQTLRRKWAIESCRAAVLPYAEQLLASAEQDENRPIASVRADVRLGEISLRVVVGDEQAKANVNEMLSRLPSATVETRLRESLSGTPLFARVRLRPGPTTRGSFAPGATPPITGFGQLFDDVDPRDLADAPRGADAPIDLFTCWGGGNLNLLRAGRAAMRMSLAPSFSPLQIERLIAARDAAMAVARTSRLPTPAARSADAVQRLLDAAKVAPPDRAWLPLAARSSCYSALIVANDGRRFWYDFAVTDGSNPRRVRTWSFAW